MLAAKKQHVIKISVVGMRALRWMGGNIRIRNVNICDMVRVASIKDKLRESRFRWL